MFEFPDSMRYVGKTVNFKVRMRAHERYEQGCPRLEQWKKRWGWSSMKIRKLAEMPNEQLNAAEVAAIAKYNTQWPNGLNMTVGGDGDSESTRLSWQNAGVRAQRVEGLVAAWKHPKKRANLMVGAEERAEHARKTAYTSGANTKRSVTWENKREEYLATLPPKEAALVRENMRKNRVKALAYKERKRQRTASSKCHPLPTKGEGVISEEESSGDESRAQKASSYSAVAPHSLRLPKPAGDLRSKEESEDEEGSEDWFLEDD